MGRAWGKEIVAATVLAVVLAAAGSAGAAVRFVHMDQFKATFQPLPAGDYGRFYPSALGGRTPLTTIANYGGCTVLKFKRGSVLSEITYVSRGNSGWSLTFLGEYRYGEVYNLASSGQIPYPAATEEKTLLAATDPSVTIRKGYRYYLCVEGQPGTNPADYNEFLGFRIRYTKP